MNRQMRTGLLLFGVVLFLFPTVRAQQRNRPTGEVPSTALRGTHYFPSFFPLQVGNEWVYTDESSRSVVQVLRETFEPNGLKYFEVSGYLPGDSLATRKLRADTHNQIYEYNPNGEDFLWYQFENSEGTWYFDSGTAVSCVTGSTVSLGDFGASIDVPAGSFERSLRLDFITQCADAGIADEYFAPGVGLVQRNLHSVAGPRTMRLVAAYVGGAELPAESYGIELSLDRPLYYSNFMPPIVEPWPTARVRLTVRNTTDLPVTFTFPTSQRFDFVVHDSLGKEMSRWSDGRAFLQVSGQEVLAKESRRYSADLALRTRDGKPLPSGFYRLTGHLTTLASDQQNMTASAAFEIRDTQ